MFAHVLAVVYVWIMHESGGDSVVAELKISWPWIQFLLAATQEEFWPKLEVKVDEQMHLCSYFIVAVTHWRCSRKTLMFPNEIIFYRQYTYSKHFVLLFYDFVVDTIAGHYGPLSRC